MFIVDIDTNSGIRVGLRGVHYDSDERKAARLAVRMDNAVNDGIYSFTLSDGGADIAARVAKRSRTLGAISMLNKVDLPDCELSCAIRGAIREQFGEVDTSSQWDGDVSSGDADRILEALS